MTYPKLIKNDPKTNLFEYVGCRSVGLSKDQTCYIIILKRVE